MNPALSVVLPCYNEAGNLPAIVSRLRQILAGRSDVEVILVDNGSQDNTGEVLARELADPAVNFIRVERVPVNLGYGHGIMAGLQSARGDFLAWTHADMQTDPSDVLLGFEKLRASPNSNSAILKGRRIHRNFFDAFFTLGMSVVASVCLWTRLYDINAQPKIFPRRFFELLKSPPDDFSLDLYVLFLARNSGFEVLTQAVSFKRRTQGESKGGGTLAGKWRLVRRTWAYIFKLRRDIAGGLR
jgi:glycosyltransferase involved in cell wall biosynthesis